MLHIPGPSGPGFGFCWPLRAAGFLFSPATHSRRAVRPSRHVARVTQPYACDCFVINKEIVIFYQEILISW